MLLAGFLVHDGQGVSSLEEAHEGEELRVRGDLEPWSAPAEEWEDVRGSLSGTTYVLHVEGVEDLVLLTGMEPGWEQQTIVADAVVVLHAAHPERAVDVIVLAVEEVKEPLVFR